MNAMHWLFLSILVVMCGVGFRIRGGALARTPIATPGQTSRLIFAVIISSTTVEAGVTWWQGLCLVPLWWLGCIIPLGGWIDLGRNVDTGQDGWDPWRREKRDFVFAVIRGLVWVALPSAFLLWMNYPRWWVLLAGGPFILFDYWLGRQSGFKYRFMGLGGFPEVGEFLTGVTWGAASVLAVQ